MTKKEMSIRTWIERFYNGDFDGKSYKVQCEAGWYDWFCKDSSLKNKTKKMGNIIKQIKDGGKVDLDKNYVWFKNNCPLSGPLYDDFRFAHIKDGDVEFTVQILSPISEKRYTVWGKKNNFAEPLLETNYSKELVKWFNKSWDEV